MYLYPVRIAFWLLKKNTSGKEIYLQHGTNLNITCKDGHIFNGYLEVHNNRVLLFDKQRWGKLKGLEVTISVDSIKQISFINEEANFFK